MTKTDKTSNEMSFERVASFDPRNGDLLDPDLLSSALSYSTPGSWLPGLGFVGQANLSPGDPMQWRLFVRSDEDPGSVVATIKSKPVSGEGIPDDAAIRMKSDAILICAAKRIVKDWLEGVTEKSRTAFAMRVDGSSSDPR